MFWAPLPQWQISTFAKDRDSINFHCKKLTSSHTYWLRSMNQVLMYLYLHLSWLGGGSEKCMGSLRCSLCSSRALIKHLSIFYARQNEYSWCLSCWLIKILDSISIWKIIWLLEISCLHVLFFPSLPLQTQLLSFFEFLRLIWSLYFSMKAFVFSFLLLFREYGTDILIYI